MKLVTSMLVTGVRADSSNKPFLAEIVTGTVIFWHCLAETMPAKVAAAAATAKDFILIAIQRARDETRCVNNKWARHSDLICGFPELQEALSNLTR